ncbi:MAG TPA: VWA domain-containing protein [Candidatus Sulfotelmatobacter sp.]|nr:VWA domain-containing protein [Candidatus Sulfotelmatobacter sp.]
MKATRAVVWLLALCFLILAVGTPLGHPQTRAQTGLVANVELVQIPVIIFDDKGAVATSLKKSDFRLFDDGVEQNILYFERERVPVSFVILADLSSSMTRKIPFVQEAALSLLYPLQESQQDRDEYSVFGIGKRSKQLLSFTRDEQDLERRLPLLLTATNESTALFDGIWFGVNTARQEAANQHRAMVIITDGGDNHSRYNLPETRRLLEEADVPAFAVMAGPSFELPAIFVPHEKKRSQSPTGTGSHPQPPNFLGARDDDYIGPAEQRGPHNMKVLTEGTGGGVFTARDEEDLPRIVRTIGLAVRYRYLLSYKPIRGSMSRSNRQDGARDPASHKIRLELYPKEKFAGYSAPYYKRGYHSIE